MIILNGVGYMKKIRIVTDSSCDLNKDIVEKYNIEIVPLNVAFGDDIYTDGEIEKDEFYKMMANSPVLPKRLVLLQKDL